MGIVGFACDVSISELFMVVLACGLCLGVVICYCLCNVCFLLLC